MSKIVAIDTALPSYPISQQTICDFMCSVYKDGEVDKDRLKVLYGRSGISKRHTVVPDYDPALQKRELFSADRYLDPVPSLESRLKLYDTHAAALGEKAALKILHRLSEAGTPGITHLITVSCTGMSAPGLDLELMFRLKLSPDIHRTSVNFMGCYAAIHALKMADAFCKADTNARVLIVCVELCTLHFQRNADYDNLTANAIFADGAAACLVTGNDVNLADIPALTILDFCSHVENKGKSDMAWKLSSTGFLMTLSAYVPQLIETGIEALVKHALQRKNIDKEDIAYWAIHPGGRKILEVIAQQLKLKREDLGYSYEVLNNYGNMSSATLLFVLKEIISDSGSGNIFAAAFGPGLTIETMLLNKSGV